MMIQIIVSKHKSFSFVLVKCCRVCNQLNHFQVSSEVGGKEVKFCPIMVINREIKPNQGRHGQRRCHVEICVHLTGPLHIQPSASHETQKQWADGGDVKNDISEGGLCFQ